MQSATTTTSVMVCATRTPPASPPTSGGLQSVERELANDDHMAEEEREGLADFRRNAPIGLRESLGGQYREFMAEHPTTRGLSIVDRDPAGYVEEQQAGKRPPRTDYSLGIGSLKGE